ncbi:MAG: pyridoxamine 5'-phosphate oxidase [Rhizobiales bacterium PAR1]|nr:MAG: pyridoxamine 5'-phosphate oxidase [Rhizobiales bacterium PAR1]
MTGESDERTNPFSLFGEWFAEAKTKEPNDPNAMALATADARGLPNVRMVLMKDYDEQGVVFYTNTQSQKGSELLENPQASVVFHWKSLRRQVRFRGTISIVTDAEADAYFASRPRDSRIGAWASQQSRPLESRFALEKAVAREAARFGLGEVPRPPHWTGFRLTPLYIEFWQDKPFRLHDRLIFTRDSADAAFRTERFYP